MFTSSQYIAYAVLVASICAPFGAAAQQPTEQLIDPIIDAMFSSIARRWGYNLLAAPEDGAAQIGKVYYVTEPACPRQLNELAMNGNSIRIFEALTLPEGSVPAPPVRGQWTSIRIASVVGSGARANLRAALADKQAELDLAFDALDKSNAQVLVGSRSIGSIVVRKSLERALKDQGITKAEDLGNGAVGALAPHAELLVQKFEFDKDAVKSKRAGVWISFLEMFGLRIAAEANGRSVSGFTLPTNSVLAFKSVGHLFSESTCPSR